MKTYYLYIHLEMAMCSKSRIIVATGSSPARAEIRLLSIVGEPTCYKTAVLVSMEKQPINAIAYSESTRNGF